MKQIDVKAGIDDEVYFLDTKITKGKVIDVCISKDGTFYTLDTDFRPKLEEHHYYISKLPLKFKRESEIFSTEEELVNSLKETN